MIDHEELIRMLHEAEEQAGVTHILGRAYHGIKRRVVTTASDNEIPIEVMAALTGTTAETLRKHYNKIDEDIAALYRHVIKLKDGQQSRRG